MGRERRRTGKGEHDAAGGASASGAAAARTERLAAARLRRDDNVAAAPNERDRLPTRPPGPRHLCVSAVRRPGAAAPSAAPAVVTFVWIGVGRAKRSSARRRSSGPDVIPSASKDISVLPLLPLLLVVALVLVVDDVQKPDAAEELERHEGNGDGDAVVAADETLPAKKTAEQHGLAAGRRRPTGR